MNFTIIIPVYNEETKIVSLLEQLEPYSKEHEILLINDGSTDNTLFYLKNCSYIHFLSHQKKQGKGQAIQLGLQNAHYDYILLMDGDLEISPKNIPQIMAPIIEKNAGAVFGSRWTESHKGKGLFDFGNWILNGIFNFVYDSAYSDVLCCIKGFNLNQIPIEKIKSKAFDIEVELSAMIIQSGVTIREVSISYLRRSLDEGKKLKIRDGFIILLRVIIFKCVKA
ncbi:MAG: glycosyltransferase family 2 protein [Candidatus Marinimicrobia bacterium]|jgi:glycosyltransferase involved in cell wall biosynthesis|nr:glycosyltransferase family 2 protein [Candidatus Neomarinimicrobiota bacterium]MBT4178269.1 glycosyltransferase family 2 protein [Candidatus Neomarinimicrobiota bacterium]MBT4991379.1 glycosyltransferase family 2 protein [Candidatus Neomarinimicrobiota bacterium]MBT5404969.1 glycosyltransferase family 2 protein [Candidatus Neomarinimicrobiota bacterium]MBT6159751.1 glycosyltransferase family 2 protein [Candidatus Neomarinimicrobiota bacterium]